MTDTRTTENTTKILNHAIRERQPDKSLILNTDRSIEFMGRGFRNILIKHKFKPSMNHLGYYPDNSHMEPSISIVKNQNLFEVERLTQCKI